MTDRQTIIRVISKSIFVRIIRCGLFIGCSVWLIACDKPATQQKLSIASTPNTISQHRLTQSEIRAKYRNCSEGYYSGPQPGKVRYTKDDYYWMVSPEFAERYCMPREFIDTQLKGALAIAYKPVQEGAEECGFGGQKEVCNRRTAHGFEIYFDNQTQIESVSDTKYNYRAFYMLPHSKHLLSTNDIQTPVEYNEWLKDRPGEQNRFKVSGWGINGIKDGKVVWPISPCREIQYIDTILPKINYLSLECTMGMGGFNNSRMQKVDVSQFVLGLIKLNDEGQDLGRPLKDFAYVIDLPDRLVKQVRVVDANGALAFQRVVQHALHEIQAN